MFRRKVYPFSAAPIVSNVSVEPVPNEFVQGLADTMSYQSLPAASLSDKVPCRPSTPKYAPLEMSSRSPCPFMAGGSAVKVPCLPMPKPRQFPNSFVADVRLMVWTVRKGMLRKVTWPSFPKIPRSPWKR